MALPVSKTACSVTTSTHMVTQCTSAICTSQVRPFGRAPHFPPPTGLGKEEDAAEGTSVITLAVEVHYPYASGGEKPEFAHHVENLGKRFLPEPCRPEAEPGPGTATDAYHPSGSGATGR